MNCANHSQTPAVAYCRSCGKALCESCKRDIRGAIYCEECLARRMEAAPPPAPAAAPGVVINPDAPNPAIAILLGFIPGVGAMYCGEFMKGVIHILIFAALVAAADQADFFGILVAFWYFYMVFDSYRTAKAKQLGQPAPDFFGLGFGGSPSSGAAANASGGASAEMRQQFGWAPQPGTRLPIGAFVLIGLGVLLMLENVGIFHLRWFGGLWPIILIAVGAYLFYRRRQRAVCQCTRCTAGCAMGPAILVTLGVLFLLNQPSFNRSGAEYSLRLGFHNTWPILLVVIGIIGFLQSNGPTTGHIGAAPPASPTRSPAASPPEVGGEEREEHHG